MTARRIATPTNASAMIIPVDKPPSSFELFSISLLEVTGELPRCCCSPGTFVSGKTPESLEKITIENNNKRKERI